MTNANTLTDKEYYQLTISVGKALNPQELPIKQKHVRAAIIATWMSNGGHAFWAIAIRQQLQDNRITAWKFLYMLHKILREGHPAVIAHSMRHRTMLTELGKLWGHLNDGYGICILQYTKLLVMKLNFHDRNARFPGNLVLKRGELEKIAGNDINIYFQLAIEMFDYLDEIIALQATIFNSITTFAVSSMTAAGQCRLVPLIPCIQDSNQLYDFCVRLMFLLHANLQEDLLVHHRERFRTIFRQLNSFYKQAGQLQYFHNLITVPHLPHNPPNFLVQADLGNYTAPKIVLMNENNDNISESDASSIVGDLVDTNAVDSPQPVEETPPLPPKIDYERLLNERDEMINKLRHEQEVQLSKARRAFSEKIEKENQLQEQVMKLTTECSDLQNEIANLKLQKQELELKAETAPELEQKVQVEEEKAKQTEEKFQKLKNMYTQIRDEHIKLLRKHDETNKTLQEKTKELQEISQEHEESKMKLQEIEVQKSTISENYQKSSIETEQLKQQFTNIEYEKKNLMDQIQSIESKKSAEIAELRINFEAVETKCKQLEEQLEKVEEEKKNLISESEGKLSENEEKFEQLKAEKENLEEEMKMKEQKLMEELELTKTTLEEKSKELEEISKQHEESKERLLEIETEKLIVTESYQKSSIESEELKEQILNAEEEKKNLIDQMQTIESEKSAEIAELKVNLEDFENKCKELEEQLEKLEDEKKILISKNEEKLNENEEKYEQLKTEKENLEEEMKLKEQKFLEELELTKNNLEEKTKELDEISKQYEESKERLLEIESEKLIVTENYQKSTIENDDLKQEILNAEEEKKNLIDQMQSIESEKSAEIAELKVNLEESENKCKNLEEEITKIEDEKKILISENEEKLNEIEGKFEELKTEKENLEKEIKEKELKFLEELEATKNELTTQSANQISEIKNNNELSLRALMEALLKGCEEISLRSVQENETLGTQTSAAYYIMIMQELQDLLDKLKVTYGGYSENCSENAEALAVTVVNSGHMLSLAFDRGMTIANASTNMISGEKIATEIKECGNISANFFKLLASNSDNATVNDSLQQLKDKLYSITNMIGDLSSNKDEIEKLEELVEAELNGMDKAIEEASKKIMEMLAQSRASDTGIKLEVNEKILDSCTDLMKFIKVLLQKSRKVQAEIIATGKGTATAKEFYKRNHQWTEGLISAAGSVAAAAKLLVESANKAVSEQSKHTLDVVVAAQEIAASVATLVVASRVKASRDSQSLRELTLASKDVTQSTSMVVATAKNCSQQLEENQELDFTKLSIHQAKTREMELQVKILELEQSIQTERMKLAALRRQNYQNGD